MLYSEGCKRKTGHKRIYGMFDSTELVKEIQEMRDDGFLSDALLRFAVRSIKEGDDRFDWVGAFLLDETANEVWLHNYVGPRTEHAKIPVGEGVTGTAVAERTNQIVADVSQVDHYIVDDPGVSSELTVLIRAGDEIYGLIDIDSMEPDAFTSEDEQAVAQVADKLAEQLVAERRPS
jgi:L-methionine (R)-S-oxide reductase